MLEGISPGLIQGVGVFAIVLMILVSLLVALYKGSLYTRPQVQEIERIQQGRVDDAKEHAHRYAVLAEKWQQAAQDAITANDANIEQGKTIVSLLEAAQRRSHRR